MVQLILPGGGITTLEEHEVLSFADKVAVASLPVQPAAADPADVDPYLVSVKLDETLGQQ